MSCGVCVVTLKEGLKMASKADNKCSVIILSTADRRGNGKTEAEVQDMKDRSGNYQPRLYMTYPAMIVNDCDMYKILKNLAAMRLFRWCTIVKCRRIRCLIEEVRR